MTNPTFTVFVGPMWATKTSKLLMTLERFKYQRKKILVFKPLIDDRYGTDNVVSHSGWTWPAITIGTGADLLEALTKVDEEPNVIAVDEAFMIPGIADVLVWLYRNGFNVIVSSLDLSAMGQPFAEVEKILPWATTVEKCTAVCTVCGHDAQYTHKKMLDGEEIQVGGAELYEPRCMNHHPVIDGREKAQ